MAAISSLAFSLPTQAAADPYDDCVEVCLQLYMYNLPVDPVKYENCRQRCERGLPPQFAPANLMDAKLD